MNFNCKRCGFETEYKCALQTHFKRKTICEPLLQDINVYILINELQKNVINEGFKCNFCEKYFKQSQGKYQHQKKCKNKEPNEVNKLKEIIIEQQKLLDESKIIINNNNNTTNNVTINLNSFSRERIDYIDPEFLKNCLKEMNMIRLLEQVHFDPEHTENHTVRVKNMNKNLLEYHQDGKWIIGAKDQIIEDMINCSGYRILKTFYRNNKESIEDEIDEYEDIIKEIDDWLDKINKEDQKIFKKLKTDIFLVILNNKAMVCSR